MLIQVENEKNIYISVMDDVNISSLFLDLHTRLNWPTCIVSYTRMMLPIFLYNKGMC